MKKKFLALVLTLAMVLSLVPVTALAADTAQSNIQYPASSVKSEDGYVELEKTAAAVAGSGNTFEITLKATVRNGTQEGTKTSTDAVLVIDRSASMEDGRINSAQEAAKQFAEVVLGSGANKENRIAVVSYAKKATTDTELSSNLETVKNAINFNTDGGTNIQAGIKAARDILQSSSANHKVILVLSDGAPTYSFRAVGTATQTGCWIGPLMGIHYMTNAKIDPTSVNITGFDYNSTAGSGSDYQYDYMWYSWRDSAELQVTCEHNKNESRDYPFYYNNGEPTIKEASYAKEAGCEIYSIYLGNDTDTNAVSTMTEIATDNDHYKLAKDASELGELFKGIAADITLPVVPGTVTDPMGDHMNLVADSLQNNSAVTTNNGGFTWDLTKVTPTKNEDGSRTYELKYQIIFDTDFDGFNATNFYPTNKETTLAYTVQGDPNPRTANFPIPKVKGTAAPTPDPDPTTDVYVYFQTQNTKGEPVDISGTSIQYNDRSWATLGKISTTQTLTSGTQYTGENDTLKAVGEEAKTKLTGNALCDKNASIAPTVLAHIQWTKLAQFDGADDYVDAGTTCWHLDGQITGYKVTYATGAGNENVIGMPTSNETYYLSGSEYTVSNATPQRTGYTFGGWMYQNSDETTYQASDKFNMLNEDVTLTAQWTPNNGTKYKVEHYQQKLDGTYERTDTDTLSGGTGTLVTAKPKTTYTGFTYDETVTGTVKSGTIAADGSLVLKLYYTRNSYGVTYQYESTDSTMPLPDAISVTEGDYAINDTNQYLYEATVTRQTSPADGATYNVVENGMTIGTWTLKWDGEKTQTMTSNGVKFVGKWTYQDTAAPGEWEFTVNQNFINAKGEKTTQPVKKKVPDTTNQTLQASIPAEMQKNQSFGNPAQNYLYIATETKYHVNDAEKNATDNLADGAVIDLYYYLDVIGGKDEKGNLIDKGDEIPDCYQVTIIYKSSDESRGKISDASPKKEVLTITDKDGNRLSSGKVEITGASAEVTGSRCYFSNWTNKDNTQVGTTATLEARTIDAKGGETYTFTANFGRSSGSGSGGSNRPKPPVVEIPDDVPTGLNGKDHYAYVVGYPDGMVYPQKNITRAEVATIFFRLLTDETREANMTKSNSYNDMKEGAWYTCAVSTLSKMGIIKGYEDGSFKPDASISRAEFAAIAARFDPDGDKTPATFSDVSSHWAKDEISIAANHGWIKGYEDGSFKPDQKITRAETMTLVNRVLKRLPETKDDLHKDMKTWPDNQNESAWFYLAVQEATNSHYQKLKKDGTHETWESMRETRDWAALEK